VLTLTTCPGATVTGSIGTRSMPLPDSTALACSAPSTLSVTRPELEPEVYAPSVVIVHSLDTFRKTIVAGPENSLE
jgi:hypothetical protein